MDLEQRMLLLLICSILLVCQKMS